MEWDLDRAGGRKGGGRGEREVGGDSTDWSKSTAMLQPPEGVRGGIRGRKGTVGGRDEGAKDGR